MKVTYIGSAAVIIEHDGTKVLCDPWLSEGIYHGSWYHYPPIVMGPQDVVDVDYIYISHVHPDHMDMDTLRMLPKTIPILVHDYEQKFMVRAIKDVGFELVYEIAHRQQFQIGNDFNIEILAADDCDSTRTAQWYGSSSDPTSTRTTQLDSMAVFHGGGHTVVNLNDCPVELARPVCEYIANKYRNIEFVLTPFAGAGPYPQCFENLTLEEMLQRGNEKRVQFLHQAAEYLRILEPKYFLPFAGQYTLGGRLSKLNPLRGIPEIEEIPGAFETLLKEFDVSSKMILLNSGESFDLLTLSASAPFWAPDPDHRRKYIEEELAGVKFPYENEFYIEKSDWVDLQPLIVRAQKNMIEFQRMVGYVSNWKIYLDTGQDWLYRIPMNKKDATKVAHGSEQEPYVRITLDYSFLKMILERKAHWNNAEIGSHLSFFRSPDKFERGLHYCLSHLCMTESEIETV